MPVIRDVLLRQRPGLRRPPPRYPCAHLPRRGVLSGKQSTVWASKELRIQKQVSQERGRRARRWYQGCKSRPVLDRDHERLGWMHGHPFCFLSSRTSWGDWKAGFLLFIGRWGGRGTQANGLPENTGSLRKGSAPISLQGSGVPGRRCSTPAWPRPCSGRPEPPPPAHIQAGCGEDVSQQLSQQGWLQLEAYEQCACPCLSQGAPKMRPARPESLREVAI